MPGLIPASHFPPSPETLFLKTPPSCLLPVLPPTSSDQLAKLSRHRSFTLLLQRLDAATTGRCTSMRQHNSHLRRCKHALHLKIVSLEKEGVPLRRVMFKYIVFSGVAVTSASLQQPDQNSHTAVEDGYYLTGPLNTVIVVCINFSVVNHFAKPART